MNTEITAEQLDECILQQFKSLENILRIAHNDKLARVIEYIADDFRSGNTDCEPSSKGKNNAAINKN